MITGNARLAGVMGWPVAHSRSPLLHNGWLARHGIDGAYVPLAVPPTQLERALHALPALGFNGCNVTVPHKEAALALVDEADDLARRVGAVNTITVVDADTPGQARLTGSNTDVQGFRANLDSLGKAWKPKRPALVVGAGGAARAVIVALAEAGTPIRLTNRTNDRALALRDAMAAAGIAIEPVAWQDRDAATEDTHLLVNTTTQGMQGQPPLDLDLRPMPEGGVVTDLVYTPLLTPLLLEARRRGHAALDGLGMLLHQAVPGFKAWFGVTPAVDAEARAWVEER